MMDGLGARLVLCLGATSPCANVFTYGVLGITLMSFSRERTPFKHLKLASFAPLMYGFSFLFSSTDIEDNCHLYRSAERTSCPKCRSSRKYFCYTCYIPVGISPDCLPTVKLPLPVDIIKHKLERVGKSTAAHACTLSPHSVNIHIYPDIPSYPDKSKVLLLYPSPDVPSLESLVSGQIKDPNESPTDSSATKKKCVQGTLCERLIVIDSTWSQAKRISEDKRLKDVQRVQLKQVETLFWR
jgi:hypothetical protein